MRVRIHGHFCTITRSVLNLAGGVRTGLDQWLFVFHGILLFAVDGSAWEAGRRYGRRVRATFHCALRYIAGSPRIQRLMSTLCSSHVRSHLEAFRQRITAVEAKPTSLCGTKHFFYILPRWASTGDAGLIWPLLRASLLG